MQKNKPDYYNNLDKVYVKIWDLLNVSLKNRNAPFHIPVFICGNKNKFDGRIVVLRGVDEKEKKIWFHSDIRSNKVKILRSNSEATLLFYDKIEKIQLRISVYTKINYQNDITERSWKKRRLKRYTFPTHLPMVVTVSVQHCIRATVYSGNREIGHSARAKLDPLMEKKRRKRL